MLLPAFRYVRPDSVEEALDELAEEGSRPLAGGQSLLNVMKHHAVHASKLVDVSRLDELRFVRVGADGSAEIGAAMTYAEIASHPELHEAHPLVCWVADHLVDRQVRSRGTIGGNCCYADPTSNYPPLLVALGATLRVADRGGAVEDVAASDFFLGPFRTRAGDGRLLVSVRLPPVPAGTGLGYRSLQLAPESWALARAAALVRADDGVIADARVVLACVVGAPRRAVAMEERLTGAAASPDVAADAAALAADGIEDPISDVHASGRYRRRMACVMARQAAEDAIAGAVGT